MKTETFRGIVRPILTLSGWFALLYLALTGVEDIKKEVVVAVAMMVSFWFGERSEKKGTSNG